MWTSPINAMFTATSSTCVTGLIVFDTYAYWSVFGQIVILCMIQIGGLSFMTVMTMFSIFLKRHLGLKERKLIMQSSGTMRLNGIVHMIKRILVGTLFFELLGTFILSWRFCPKMGFSRGVYNALFHSVSAFCNAGFDLMGRFSKFSSLTTFYDDPVVCITIAFLILIGGIGFFVWSDLIEHKFNFKNYELHTKIVLITTIVLTLIGWIIFFVFEYDGTMKDMTVWQKLYNSFFQSVTPRTAGFNTVDQTKLSTASLALTIIYMFIGASPGSTGGGIKTSTFAVLFLSAISSARKNNSVTVFRKRLDEDMLKQASSIATIYLLWVSFATIFISAFEQYDLTKTLYEVVSAVGTVGLTTGITPLLNISSKFILMLLMFTGRIGGLSIVLMLAEKRANVQLDRPSEKILVG